MQKELGAFSACAVGDVDNDGKLNLLIGQDLGGVYHLEHSEGSSLGWNEFNIEITFTVYPNPFENEFIIESKQNDIVEIFTLMGQKVADKEIFVGTNYIKVPSESNGIYLLKVKSSGKVVKLVRNVKN